MGRRNNSCDKYFAKSEYRLKINDEIIMTIEVEQIKIKKKEKHLTELVINRVLVR